VTLHLISVTKNRALVPAEVEHIVASTPMASYRLGIAIEGPSNGIATLYRIVASFRVITDREGIAERRKLNSEDVDDVIATYGMVEQCINIAERAPETVGQFRLRQ